MSAYSCAVVVSVRACDAFDELFAWWENGNAIESKRETNVARVMVNMLFGSFHWTYMWLDIVLIKMHEFIHKKKTASFDCYEIGRDGRQIIINMNSVL